MLNSFEEFKTAVHKSLADKIRERLDTEREYISNTLMRGDFSDDSAEENESNTDGN